MEIRGKLLAAALALSAMTLSERPSKAQEEASERCETIPDNRLIEMGCVRRNAYGKDGRPCGQIPTKELRESGCVEQKPPQSEGESESVVRQLLGKEALPLEEPYFQRRDGGMSLCTTRGQITDKDRGKIGDETIREGIDAIAREIAIKEYCDGHFSGAQKHAEQGRDKLCAGPKPKVPEAIPQGDSKLIEPLTETIRGLMRKAHCGEEASGAPIEAWAREMKEHPERFSIVLPPPPRGH